MRTTEQQRQYWIDHAQWCIEQANQAITQGEDPNSRSVQVYQDEIKNAQDNLSEIAAGTYKTPEIVHEVWTIDL